MNVFSATCLGMCPRVNPCQNGGACLNEADGYRCQCPSGYKGPECADVDHCAASPCQNNGTCLNEAGGYRCECPSGYTGPACADVDDCPLVNPCQNGGICVDGVESFTCNCATNFTGPTCRLSNISFYQSHRICKFY